MVLTRLGAAMMLAAATLAYLSPPLKAPPPPPRPQEVEVPATAPQAVKNAALVAAVKQALPKRVAKLLRAGADPNARDEGRPALTVIGDDRQGEDARDLIAPHAQIVRMLLKAGADARATDGDGGNGLFGIFGGETIELLARAGADVNARNRFDLTPLLTVGDDAAAFALLKAGADPHTTDVRGTTVQELAARSNWEKTLRWLRDHDALR